MKVYHVLNKNSLGGAESLVNSILCFPESFTTHQVIYLAGNRFEKYLLGKRFLRYFLFMKFVVVTSIKFICTRQKMVVVFHLAETHLCGFFIFNLTRKLNRDKKIKFIIYLHQSKKLYPERLIMFLEKFITVSDAVICYSKTVLEDWISYNEMSTYGYKIHEIRNCIKKFESHVGENHSKILKNSEFKLRFVFVGRNVSWKRPNLALDYVLDFQKLFPNIGLELNYIGINSNEMKLNTPLPAGLDIIFHGRIITPIELISSMDFLISPANTNMSIESIGIAALEALALGVPVITSTNATSTYLGMPGVFSIFDVLSTLEHFQDANVRTKFSSDEIVAKFDFDREFWSYETSVEVYMKNFNNALDLLNESAV